MNCLFCESVKCVQFFLQHALKAGISTLAAGKSQVHLMKKEMEILARRQPWLTQLWPALLAKQPSGTVAFIKCSA